MKNSDRIAQLEAAVSELNTQINSLRTAYRLSTEARLFGKPRPTLAPDPWLERLAPWYDPTYKMYLVPDTLYREYLDDIPLAAHYSDVSLNQRHIENRMFKGHPVVPLLP